MPKIYEYLGIVFFFYSNEHEPIHIHGKYGEQELKAEFVIENGEIKEIRIKSVKNVEPIRGRKLNDFKRLIEKYSDEIVEKWIDYFVLHKKIKSQRIQKLK